MSTKIKINSTTDPKNFFCVICKFPLATQEDFEKNTNFGCCNGCYTQFAEARKEKWLDGWRPKRKEVDSYIKLRNKIILSGRKL